MTADKAAPPAVGDYCIVCRSRHGGPRCRIAGAKAPAVGAVPQGDVERLASELDRYADPASLVGLSHVDAQSAAAMLRQQQEQIAELDLALDIASSGLDHATERRHEAAALLAERDARIAELRKLLQHAQFWMPSNRQVINDDLKAVHAAIDALLRGDG